MLAARIHELGAEPVVEQADEPAPRDGGLLVELGAASINPVDLTISRGAFYMPTPPRPYVAGQEGVGRVLSGGARFAPGTRVYTDRARSGTLAERFVTAEADAYELPDGDDDALAVALGVVGQTGWLTIAERAGVGPDDRVLVLAATGAVGSVALQAAKLLGAQLVVAAGREPERLERARALGADATVQLSGEGD